jgi:cytosine/adenosine deaminase-related metal-dependent hydrolase
MENLVKDLIYLVLLLSLILAGYAGHTSEDNHLSYAITYVNLVPMNEEIILEDQTILIEGWRIVAIGAGDEINIPKGATVIDGTGLFLMSGPSDMHWNNIMYIYFTEQ